MDELYNRILTIQIPIWLLIVVGAVLGILATNISREIREWRQAWKGDGDNTDALKRLLRLP
jgi:hypothetical protein